MRRYRRYAAWGAAFAVLVTLGAATAAWTAGAAPFGTQATTTIVSTITTGNGADAVSFGGTVAAATISTADGPGCWNYSARP